MSSTSVKGRLVVVIGASSGIGRGVAEHCIAEGAEVILAARRLDALQEVVARAGGGHPVITDLRDEISCVRLAEEIARRGNPIDLVLISAGVAPLRRIARTSPQDWRDALDTNLIGIHRVIVALLDHLAPTAVIAAVSSEAVGSPRSHLGAYGASKAALEHTFAQWREEHPSLRFTTISLGATVPTEFGQNFEREELIDAFNAWTVAGRNSSKFMSTPDVCEVLFATLSGLLAAPSVGMPRIDFRSPTPPEINTEAALELATANSRPTE